MRVRGESIPFGQKVTRTGGELALTMPRDSLRKLVWVTDLVCRKLDGTGKAGDGYANETGATWRENDRTRRKR
jgi:hypothetical protein